MAITIDCIQYRSEILKRIGSLAKSVSHYGSFLINTPIRAWVIALGIRARPARFRRSRAGKNLFYYIASITYRQHCDVIHRRAVTPVHAVNWNNSLFIKTRDNSSQSQLTSALQEDLHSALINCRSVVNKTQEIQLQLVNNNLDLCILTETWTKEGDTIAPTRLCPSGYKSLSISRHEKVGGGIAIVYKSKFNISIARSQSFKTMESTCFIVNTENWLINLIIIYRPPDSNVFEFCNELTNVLETNINSSGELILLGDFNIAVNKPFDVETGTSFDILDSFNLFNKVDKPTHRLSNTLDLIIHDADSNIIPRIKVNRLSSDHNIVLFDISTPCTITTSKVQVYRKFKDINLYAFMKDVREFCLNKPPGPSLDDKTNHYYTMLQTVLDHHAPIKSHKCSNHPKVPWFKEDITKAIRLQRCLKRIWHRDRSNVEAFTLFHCQCQLISNLLDKAEWEFFLTSITENSMNYKCIYDICNHLLGRTKDSPLPHGITNKDLANRFNNCFIDKIVKIHTDLIGKCQHLPPYVEIPAPQGHRSSAISSQSPFLNFKRSSYQHQAKTVNSTQFKLVY